MSRPNRLQARRQGERAAGGAAQGQRLRPWAGPGCPHTPAAQQRAHTHHHTSTRPTGFLLCFSLPPAALHATHLPTCSPPKMKLMARLRWSVGIARATMSVAADGATPSPSPTAARDRNRPGSVPASSGTPAVATARGSVAAVQGQGLSRFASGLSSCQVRHRPPVARVCVRTPAQTAGSQAARQAAGPSPTHRSRAPRRPAALCGRPAARRRSLPGSGSAGSHRRRSSGPGLHSSPAAAGAAQQAAAGQQRGAAGAAAGSRSRGHG